jgi:branched-chain amino acid transport system permease protein
MEFFFQLFLSGICVGAVYAMGAIGFVLVYKSTAVFNLAHGQMMMMGAFFTVTFAAIVGLPMWLSFLLGIVMTAIMGFVIQFLVIRPLTGQPLFAIFMVTVGLIFIIKGVSLLIWGYKYYSYPGLIFPMTSLSIGGVHIADDYIISVCIAIIFISVIGLYFKFTKTGLTMRATAEDVQLAESMGVRVGRIFGMAWILAGIAAAVGGVSLGVLTNINLALGEVGLKVLPVVVFGGLESIAGACIGGLVVGIVSTLSAGYLAGYLSGFDHVVPFIIMLLVLLIRPHGLFGEKRVERI